MTEERETPDVAALRREVVGLKADISRLVEENHHLRELYERAPLGYQSLDEKGNFLSVNQSWLDALGYRAEEVIGKNFGDFLHPDWRDHFKENFPHFKAVGEILGVEFELQRKDGSYVYVSFNGRIGRDPEGNFQQTYCIFQDITRQKQAEQTLTHSASKWRNILTNTPQIGISLDPQGRIVFANTHFLQLIGCSEEEVLGSDWFERFIPGHCREQVRTIFHTVMGQEDTAQFSNYENEIVTRGGELRNVAWSNVLSKDINGKIIDVTCLGVDLTERQLAMEALRESENRFRISFYTSPDAVNINRLDDGRYIEVNEGFIRLTGYTPDDVLGKSSLEINLWCNPEDRKKLVNELRDKGYCENLEAEFRRKDGSIGVGLMSARILEWQGEAHILSVTRDITDHKQLETQLIQAQKMESVGRLAGGVAHDFNNMLGVILGYSEMAIEQVAEDQSLHSALQGIHQAAQRSADLTRQLLAFARKQTVTPKVLDLNQTLEGMINMLRRLIGEHIQLTWLPGDDVAPVKIDPSQIDQILANLCVNARDAIGERGKITIETGNVLFDQNHLADHAYAVFGEYVMLAVSDDGCGMDKETIGHVFEPFFTTKRVGEGTGMGLATVYGIVKQNNGFINVYSELGRGTTLKIYLPKYARKADLSLDGAESATPSGTETILLVEDEPMILEMVTTMLQHLGYQVLGAATPGEALRLTYEYPGEIRLLMTDVVMPEMNGRDLADLLSSSFPDLNCLFMSGYTANVIAHHGILDEGYEFIQKPFTMKTLSSKIRQVLDRKRP